jgi:hypothetical protein
MLGTVVIGTVLGDIHSIEKVLSLLNRSERMDTGQQL